MKKKLWLAFASFAVVGALMGVALPASAWSVRQNGAYCMTTAGANVSHGGNGVSNASTTQVAVLSCPVIDTSATPHTGVTALSIFAVDNSTTAAVRTSACVQFTTVPGGTCGLNSNSSVGGTGLVNLSPTRAAWGGASDLPYLFVELPARATSGAMSFLLGYSFSG
jgi:hypothetical protein